jgi:hypothetical protein
VKVGQVPEALVEVEPVAHEELVRDGEADVANGQVLHEAPVGAVEQGHGGERGGRPQRERLAEVVERQAGVDDVLDDQDVPAGDLRVEVLEQADPGVAATVGAGGVAGQLEEVEAVRDAKRP